MTRIAYKAAAATAVVAMTLSAAPPVLAAFLWKGATAPAAQQDGNQDGAITAEPLPAPSASNGTAGPAQLLVPDRDEGRGEVASLPAPTTPNVVEGFAQDLPLSIAVEQIVPSGMTTGFGRGVTGSEVVSWSGGSDWRDVLRSMLRDAGMDYSEHGTIITIAALPQDAEDSSPANTAMTSDGGDEPSFFDRLFGARGESGDQVAEKPAAAGTRPAMPEVQEPAGWKAPEVRKAPTVAKAPAKSVTGEALAASPQDLLRSAVPVEAEPVTTSGGDYWEARRGMTLHTVLDEWAAQAGWNVAWMSERDYRLEASAVFRGTFDDVIRQLIGAFAQADPPVQGTMYRGNNVLVVKTLKDGESVR